MLGRLDCSDESCRFVRSGEIDYASRIGGPREAATNEQNRRTIDCTSDRDSALSKWLIARAIEVNRDVPRSNKSCLVQSTYRAELFVNVANHQFDPDRCDWIASSLPFLYLACLLAGMLNPAPTRSIPGGPFVSVTGDLIPFLVGAVSLVCSVIFCTHTQTKIRIAAIILAGVSIVLMFNAVLDVYNFAVRPAARGSLFGI